jgi:Raf kinase inhibitor-like YbhB/YbcL family protein
MKKVVIFGLMIAGLALAQNMGRGGGKKGPSGPGLTLTTTAWEDGAVIPSKFTGSDPHAVSPKLDWTNVPANTVSFALIMHDPDVALQKHVEDFLHWAAFNIPGDAHGLPEGVPNDPTLPDGTIQLKNRNVVGYRGPGAPAAGPLHHYVIELYALDTKLELNADATRDDLLKAMDGHVLGKASIVGRHHL